MIEINELAQGLYDKAIANHEVIVSTWWDCEYIYDEWKLDRNIKSYRIKMALRKGVKMGLFESGRWMGIGMTPWTGSARRTYVYPLIKKKAQEVKGG